MTHHFGVLIMVYSRNTEDFEEPQSGVLVVNTYSIFQASRAEQDLQDLQDNIVGISGALFDDGYEEIEFVFQIIGSTIKHRNDYPHIPILERFENVCSEVLGVQL